MSYLALARKWRPGKFSEVVGQSHVLTALENALQQNRLHHAYLLSGTRGVGKTTIGRLFAKGLNCETGITHTPCGECSSCREIDDGRFVDLLEIDAASRTKVEDTRELLDNVQYKPARGRFKVYLIDEVHMLSRHSFNALLKTLEEPPEYVKFILATTDPQKLPVTILSRCLQFHLKPIDVDEIHQQLETILTKESVAFENKALGMIAHAADGSMRDALSLTDQGIALGNGQIGSDLIGHMLGTLDTDHAVHLLESLAQKQAQSIFDHVELLAKHGVDWNVLLKEVSNQLHRIALYQALPSTLDEHAPDAERIALLSQNVKPEEIQLYYQIALKGREEMSLAPSLKAGVEMTLLRMLAFRPNPTQTINTFDAPVESQAQTATPPVPPQQPNVVPVVATRPTSMDSAKPAPAVRQPVSQPTETVQQPTFEQQQSPVQQQSAPPPYEQPNYDNQPPDYPPSDYQSDYDQAPHYQESSQPAPIEPPLSQPVVAPEPQQRAVPSSLTAMRHQLRSKRAQLSNDESGDSGVKKSNPASKKSSSVFERVASKPAADSKSHLEGFNESQLRQNNEIDSNAEKQPYQWKAKKEAQVVVDKGLTPTQIKQALEHTKTPEMVEKLKQESANQDTWTKLILQLNVPKLVEQLALNSFFEQQGNSITLKLRNAQKHLVSDRAVAELKSALDAALGSEHQLTVIIGEEGQSPLELRDKIYQGKLQQAMTSLQQDSNIQFIQARFAAELDEESVRPI